MGHTWATCGSLSSPRGARTDHRRIKGRKGPAAGIPSWAPGVFRGRQAGARTAAARPRGRLNGRVAAGDDGGAYGGAVMDDIRFQLLGPMEILVEGAPAKLPGVAERALLVQLLLAPGRTIPATLLVDRLWSEATLPVDPMNALQIRVSKLRRALRAMASTELVTREGVGYRAARRPVPGRRPGLRQQDSRLREPRDSSAADGRRVRAAPPAGLRRGVGSVARGAAQRLRDRAVGHRGGREAGGAAPGRSHRAGPGRFGARPAPGGRRRPGAAGVRGPDRWSPSRVS